MTRNIIVTTSTVSDCCIQMIESLKNGTVVPDVIYVAVPEGADPALSGRLEEAGANVISSQNYGTLTNLIPFLEVDVDPESFVIVVNDGVTYHTKFIEGLVTGYDNVAPNIFKEHNIDVFVGYQGYEEPEKSWPRFYYRYKRGHGMFSDIIDTRYGFGFVRKCMFGLPHIDPMTKDSEKYAYLSDSYIYSKHLTLNNTHGQVIRWYDINEDNVITDILVPEPDENKLLNGYITGRRVHLRTVPTII
jgi:hypothetical protein